MDTFTKIICTIGTVSKVREILTELTNAGPFIARINMSHDKHFHHQTTIDNIREIEKTKNIKIPIGLDTKGPELRISNLTTSFSVNQDDLIYLTNTSTENQDCFVIPLKNLFDLPPNTEVFVDDGSLKLKVLEVKNGFLVTKAMNNHVVTPRKKINIPGFNLGIEFLSEEDKSDILFGLQNKVDFIFASFVSTIQDLVDLKTFIKSNCTYTPIIISKLESVEGMNNLDSIIDLSDGIMVARGDLAVEIGHFKTFNAQKLITKKTKEKGKILIIATQMLESMRDNPVPTRAEVTDVGNAVLDGADCVMLSAETASGKYPILAFQTMINAIKVAEQMLRNKEIEVFLENCPFDCLVLEIKNIGELDWLMRLKVSKPILVKTKVEILKRQLKIRRNVFVVEDERSAMNDYGFKSGVLLHCKGESIKYEVFYI